MSNLPTTTLPTDTSSPDQATASCPSWCTHADACDDSSYQGPMRKAAASAAMLTEFDTEPGVDVVRSFVQQDPRDPAPFVYLDGHHLRVHEVRTLIRQLQQHVTTIEGGAR